MSNNPYSSPSVAPVETTAHTKVQLPAIFLLTSSLCGIAFVTLGAGFWVVRLVVGDLTPSEVELAYRVIMFAIVNLLVCGLVIAGAISMLSLKPRWLALAGAWAALIPLCGPCYILAIPFGIWALVVLSKPDVIAAFQNAAVKRM